MRWLLPADRKNRDFLSSVQLTEANMMLLNTLDRLKSSKSVAVETPPVPEDLGGPEGTIRSLDPNSIPGHWLPLPWSPYLKSFTLEVDDSLWKWMHWKWARPAVFVKSSITLSLQVLSPISAGDVCWGNQSITTEVEEFWAFSSWLPTTTLDLPFLWSKSGFLPVSWWLKWSLCCPD